MSKKGALELSMNTIIIIVIGVVLLSLGLVFVRGIFSQTTDLSYKVFADANRQLDSLGGRASNSLVISPETIRIEAGKTSGFIVLVTNLKDNENYNGLTGTLQTLDQGITCQFTDGTIQKPIRTLVPGAEDRLQVLVKSQEGSLGTKTCKFTLGNIPQVPTFDPEVEAIIIIS